MAYVYQKAWVRELGPNKHWHEADISAMTITAILNTYADVIVVLTNQYIQGNLSFELTKNIPLFTRPNLTLTGWLNFNGNTTLPTIAGVPSVEYKTAEYASAHQANFHVKKVHPDTHPDVYSVDALLKDLLLTRVGANYEFIQRRTMVNVNGIFHRTESTLHGVYVKNGGETSRIGNNNEIGVLSFANVGELQYIAITPDNLYKQHDEQSFSKRAYVDTGLNLENKTVLLVLAGVLHVLDDTYHHIGNGQIAIKTEKTNWMRRFVELRKQINVHSIVEKLPSTYIPEEESVNGTNSNFAVSELFADEAIEQFLLLPQSFLVVIDTPYINTVTKAVESTRIPGVSLAYEKPTSILKHRNGFTSSYTRVKQHHLWSLQYKPQYERNYYFETTNWNDLLITNDAEDILSLYKSDHGYLLEIGKEVLTIE